MFEPLVYIDHSEFSESHIDELRESINELVRFVETHEPQLLSYSFYIDEAAGRMTLVAVHPDSASLEVHMEVAGPVFRRFTHLVKLVSIEIYGRPSRKALAQLREKARLLGEGQDVVVTSLHAGFSRYAST